MDASDETPTSSTNEPSRRFYRKIDNGMTWGEGVLARLETLGVLEKVEEGHIGMEVHGEVVGEPVEAPEVIRTEESVEEAQARVRQMLGAEAPGLLQSSGQKVENSNLHYRLSDLIVTDLICPECGEKEHKAYVDIPLRYWCVFCGHSWNYSPLTYKNSPGGEIRHTDPDTGGQKGVKPQRYSLMPWGALDKVSELYGSGAQKYAEHNWRLGYDWSKSMDALMRHLKAWWEEGEEIDPDRHCHHLTAVVFHALALLEFTETHPEKDDRYISKKDV